MKFNWTGGDLIPEGIDQTPEVYVCEAGTGLQINVPANNLVQTLNLYTGVYGNAELDASISDGSSPNILDSSVVSLGEAEKTYSIDFRAASGGQTLTVQLKVLSPDGCLNLQAASLNRTFLKVAIVSPQDSQSFVSGSSIPVNVTANQYDSDISSVQIIDNSAQIFEMSLPPYAATWNGATAGHHQLQSRATDTAQLQTSSRPTDIDVIGTGGSLSVSLGQTTGTVDLTSEGAAYWKLFQPFESKANVASAISDYASSEITSVGT